MRFTDALRYMLLWLPVSDEIAKVFGSHPWPRGIEVNRETLEAAVECLLDQRMIGRKLSVEELFVQPRGQSWKVGWGPIDVVK